MEVSYNDSFLSSDDDIPPLSVRLKQNTQISNYQKNQAKKIRTPKITKSKNIIEISSDDQSTPAVKRTITRRSNSRSRKSLDSSFMCHTPNSITKTSIKRRSRLSTNSLDLSKDLFETPLPKRSKEILEEPLITSNGMSEIEDIPCSRISPELDVESYDKDDEPILLTHSPIALDSDNDADELFNKMMAEIEANLKEPPKREEKETERSHSSPILPKENKSKGRKRKSSAKKSKPSSLAKYHAMSDSEESFADVAEILAVSKQQQQAITNSPDPNLLPKVTKKMRMEEERNKKKLTKNLIQLKNAQLKGDLQYMTVVFDAEFQNQNHFQDVLDALARNQIKHSFVETHPSPLCIKWQREVVMNIGDDPSDAVIECVDEKYVFILIPLSFMIPLVETFKLNPYSSEPIKLLGDFYRNQRELNPHATLRFAVLGLKTHFKKQKQRNKTRNLLDESQMVTDIDVDDALITFKYDLDISISSFEIMEDLGQFLALATKSVAQAQHKKDKRNNVAWFAPGDKAGMIKIDERGKGSLKLWKQQILQFNAVGKEIVEAIVKQYPSPRLLLSAYAACPTESAAVNLLKNINISRGIGSAATSRCIGPKLSHKLHTLLTSSDPDLLLR